jgi:hypothetical protein
VDLSGVGGNIAIAVEWQSFGALATSCRFALTGPSSWCAVPIPSLTKAWATVVSVLKAAQRKPGRSGKTSRISLVLASNHIQLLSALRVPLDLCPSAVMPNAEPI